MGKGMVGHTHTLITKRKFILRRNYTKMTALKDILDMNAAMLRTIIAPSGSKATSVTSVEERT
jgi:hypothetical protein